LALFLAWPTLGRAEVRDLTLADCINLAVKANNDAAKGRLDRLLSRLDRQIGQDYFQPDFYLTPASDYNTDEEGRWTPPDLDTELSAFCSAYRIEVAASVGFFDEGYRYYYGDSDLALRQMRTYLYRRGPGEAALVEALIRLETLGPAFFRRDKRRICGPIPAPTPNRFPAPWRLWRA